MLALAPAPAARLHAAPAVAARRARCAPVAAVVAPRSFFAGVSLPPARARRASSVRRAAAPRAEAQFDTEEVIKTLQEKWEQTENKTSIALYAGGAVAAVWASATIVGVVNAIPLLPKIMELVGLGYSSWFVYRYLLFKESRKELVADVEELKAKISGKSE